MNFVTACVAQEKKKDKTTHREHQQLDMSAASTTANFERTQLSALAMKPAPPPVDAAKASFLEALMQRYGAVDSAHYDFSINQKRTGAATTSGGTTTMPTTDGSLGAIDHPPPQPTRSHGRNEKHWELVGMEKTRVKQLRHDHLSVLVLNSCNLVVAERLAGEIRDHGLVKVAELDLANNPMLSVADMAVIVGSLPALKELQLNDNVGLRAALSDAFVAGPTTTTPWSRLTTLTLNRTWIPWASLVSLADVMPHLRALHAAGNGYGAARDGGVRTLACTTNASTSHGELIFAHGRFPSLTELNLSENQFSSWESVDQAVGTLLGATTGRLQILSINSNALGDLPPPFRGDLRSPADASDGAAAADSGRSGTADASTHCSLPTLRRLAASLVSLGIFDNNQIRDFAALHRVGDWFPKCHTLRVSYAPLFQPGADVSTPLLPAKSPPTAATSSSSTPLGSDDVAAAAAVAPMAVPELVARHLVIAALPQLEQLNQGTVRPKERVDAELSYIQRATAFLTAPVPASSSEQASTPAAPPPAATDAKAEWQQAQARRVALLFPQLPRLKSKHANAVMSSTQATEGMATFLLKLTLRNESAEEMTRSLPSTMAVAKLKVIIAALWPKAVPVKQELAFTAPAEEDTIPVLIPLDNDYQPLSYFGVPSGSVIHVKVRT